MIEIVRAKMHGIRVTGADITYHGSVTLDPEQCEAVGIYPLEFVNIWNKNTGARIRTYVIYGEAGSRCCVLNGAAARTCAVGDEVIITATEQIDPNDLCGRCPKVLTFGEDNKIEERFQYRVGKGKERTYEFFIDKLK
ncbi:MAG: aspartate 1-decarboxylase [Alphaproteobacteria bacterium]|nr:aspartate 1-decarboxylase [Alphaproteobacteria bacterium]